LYPIVEKFVDDAWIRLNNEQITPWAFLNAGPAFTCKDFYGRTISYQGIAFDGSPRQVFWGRYIEPFLEDITDKVVVETLRLSVDKQQDATLALAETSGLLKSLVRRAYRRMAEIDRRLRGNGNPESVPLRSTESEVASTEQFIDRRIGSEIAMLQPKPKRSINDYYNANPFLFWLIPLLIAIIGIYVAMV
jgi:hypothetical protein